MAAIYILYFIYLVLAFFAGAALGSGAACLVMRSAHKESWAKGRSHCDSCGHVLAWKDLIPVISYLKTKGRCRYCGAAIPRSCLITEIVFGLIGAAVVAVCAGYWFF